jgi:zinc-dependent metalloproteinase lipoprotein
MKQITWILAIGCWLLTAGCSKSDDTTNDLAVDSESFVWNSDVRLQTIQVKANGKWGARSDVYWCAPIKKSGEGNMELPIWVSPNLTKEARQGTITITQGNEQRVIHVSQPAFSGSLDDYEYHLPVVFHILYQDENDEQQYVKKGHMEKILTEVNKIYANNKMGIVFELAQYNDNGEQLEEPGVVRHHVDFSDYEPNAFLSSKNDDNRQYAKFAQNMKKYINVYVFHFKQASENKNTMGVSNLPIVPLDHPLDSLQATDAANDYAYTAAPWGCLINNEYIYEWQEGNTFNPNFIASTIAHELGHYLGLLHTFSAVECTMDDACDDTPISDYENYSVYIRAYIDQQVAAGVRIFSIADLARRKDCKTLEDFTASNVMDYAYCLNSDFTLQQRQRTRHILQYSPLVPGPKLILYNTTGKITRGVNTPRVIEEHIQPCPAGILHKIPIR